jgi:hypothetical protein
LSKGTLMLASIRFVSYPGRKVQVKVKGLGWVNILDL